MIHEVYAYLRLRNASGAIDFYRRAFGAEELFRLTEPSGRVGHAEIKIGGVTLMLSDEFPDYGVRGPESLGGTTFSLHLHTDDVEALWSQAVGAGATVVHELTNHFHGERCGTLRDPFGHEWLLGQMIEQVSPEEMQRRYTAMFQ